MSISTAIGTERLSRVSGYQINKGFFNNDTPNLPQIIVILGEANVANQGSLDTLKKEVTSADQAGQLYGYGSPIHQIMRILRPVSGDGVGGIPTIVIPQESAEGATQSTIEWTVTGTASANATHKIVISGRDGIDSKNYNFSVAAGNTPTIIAGKIKDAINAVQGSPVIAANVAGVLTLTTKWAGLTSIEVSATISNNGIGAGVTYAQTDAVSGAGAVDLTGAFAQFEDNWYTTVINSYGSAALGDLEDFNGVPDDTTPTGRYAGEIFKPFMAFFGSTLASVSALEDITDAAGRVSQVTNVLCPAPNSAGCSWEAAANMVALFCRVMQDNPHLDVNGKSYPDMPIPSFGLIGEMADYNNRDLLVKAGCSTVTLTNGAYQVQDLVTTYHPDGETPLQYSYCRNLNLDWNVKDGYSILENRNVKDHTLVGDLQITSVPNVIKPKEWKSILFEYFDHLADIALINDSKFSKNSLSVVISTINPNRFETKFSYKRTGLARIESTTAVAGF